MKTSMKKLVITGGIPLLIAGGMQWASAAETEQSYVQLADNYQAGAKEKRDVAAGDKQAQADTKQAFRDAWLQGKLEGALALNRHLNPFTIDTEVASGVATLSGHVESDIDRELAGEVAKSIDGITHVENKLEVKAKDGAPGSTSKTTGEYSWSQRVDDLTTTASVKSKLLTNREVKGLDINVTTKNDIVSLEGNVSSDEERNLAELVAKNTEGVKEVANKIKVSK